MSPSTQSHLSELKRKHHSIDDEIRQATTRPGTDTTSLTLLKRRKLRIKDRIGEIESTLH